MPEDAKKCEAHEEKHYSVPELAELWNLSQDTIRRLFADEPGVLVLSNRDGGRNRCRRYATRLIPESVVRRVHLRLATPPKPVLYQSPVKTVPQPVTQRNQVRGNAPGVLANQLGHLPLTLKKSKGESP
jgi:hypothetical protein